MPFTDPIQQRYELIRPLLLGEERTARQRAEDTATHPETVGALKRRFAKQGMLGLVPGTLVVLPAGRRRRGPDDVVAALQRLKSLYDGFGYRELARIIFHTCARRLSHHSVQKLWHRLPPAFPQQLPLLDYHRYPTRAQARLEVITRYCEGGSKRSISRFLHVSRPTIDEWITRFEVDNLGSLEDKSRTPHSTTRQAWLPVMVEVYHLQKRHPDAGDFRIWSLRGKTDLSVRTIERIMAINRHVYTDIPGAGPQRHPTTAPQPHPFNATVAHEYWFIDGRIMDLTVEGVQWWSVIVLDGYSRTMLAGAVAPSEARWVAMTVLYSACRRYGVPQHIISDTGGASISDAFEGVCARLGIAHLTMGSTQGQSDMNLRETPCNIQRRLDDYQLSLTRTPLEFEQAHQRFLALYNTTAHQGLLKEQLSSPIPLHVLGNATGRLDTPRELEQKFSRALLRRTTNRYGCVTLHRYHFAVDHGAPQQAVLLWVYGQELRAVCETVLVASYHGHSTLRSGQVTAIRDGTFYPSPFAACQQQGALIPLNPYDSVGVYRPKAVRRPTAFPRPVEQLGLFERVTIA